MLIEDPKSNQVVANSILKELKRSGYNNFTARPWNYYEAATTLWWLVPSTEWPSYKYGKIVVYREKEKYRIGLNVEKGITQLVAATHNISVKEREKVVIKEDWKWYELLRDIENGKLQEILAKITNEIEKPLKIIIQASEYRGPDSKVVKIDGLELDNIITFEYNDSEFKCIEKQTKG